MNFDALGAGVGGEHHDFADERVGIHGLQLQFERAREVEKSLDDAVEAVDFGGDDLDVRVWVLPGFEFGVEQFEVQHHCVQRIFDFVRDAGSDAAERREFGGVIELRFQLAERFEVAERKQRARRLAAIFKQLQRGDDGLRRAAVGGHFHRLLQGLARHKRAFSERAQSVAGAERVGQAFAAHTRVHCSITFRLRGWP